VLDPQVQALAVPEPLSAPFAEHWKHVEGDLSATLAELSEEKQAQGA
jgi:hypothetical protein